MMGKRNNSNDDDFDWDDIERVTKNFKGSVDDIEEIILDEIQPKKKKKNQLLKNKFLDD
jgi:hypothetical protein